MARRSESEEEVMYKINQPLKKPRPKRKAAAKPKVETETQRIYHKYLRSDTFKEVKDIVHQRAGNRCEVCGRTLDECEKEGLKLSVHHISYEHLGCGGTVEADDCRLLDNRCHYAIHQVKANIPRFKDKSMIYNNLKKRYNDDVNRNSRDTEKDIADAAEC